MVGLASVARGQETAQRLSVRVGETLVVPLAEVEALMCIEEHTAQVVVSPGGFTVVGRAYGDTVLQVYTSSGMRVYVVHVAPPPPRPPGPPPIANINDHGAITSFWGDNRYEIRYSESSLLGSRFDHLLSFHGRAVKGEYQANAQFMTGALGDRLQYSTVTWQSDAKDLLLEAGDTSGRLFGSSLSGTVPLRGARSVLARKFGQDRGEWTGEIVAGEIRNAADPYATSLSQPAAGASMAGGYTPARMPALHLSFGSSLLAFSTAPTSAAQSGDSGVTAGGVFRAVHEKGFGLELRTAFSAAAPHTEGGAMSVVPSFGLSGQHQNPDGTERIEYENNRPGMVVPQNGGSMPGSHRISASFERRARGVSVSGSAGYALVETLAGQSGGGLSYRFGTTVPVGRQSRFSLSGGQSTVTMPIVSVNGQQYLRDWSRTFLGTRLDHAPRGGLWTLGSDLTLAKSRSGDTGNTAITGTFAVQRRRAPDGKWDAGGTLSAVATQAEIRESVLAVEQPPLDFGVAASTQGRFVQGPFESFGGLGLQVKASPTFQAAPTVNLGFRFTPTAAHQIALNYSSSRWLQSAAWNHFVSAAYTYHFGDAVRAVPIFEFMSYGVVEGRVCFDEDSDGVCAPDETGIPGVPLVLSNGARSRSAADGSYRFERLKPGFYHLDVDEAAMREKGRPTTVLAATFDLAVRGSERKSFAVARACRIRGHLVHDLDMNGRIDEDEPLFGGPMVLATSGSETYQARVNNNGTFAMTVPCGEYGLELDSGSLPSMHSPGDDEEIRVTTTASDTPEVKLMVRSVRTIAGTVFIDRNGNGERDTDEPIVAGAKVRFGQGEGQTDETGAYLLRRLPTGAGELMVDPASLPAGVRPGATVSKTLPKDAAALENVDLPVIPD